MHEMSSFYSYSLAFLVVITVGIAATEHQLAKARTGAVFKDPDALLLVNQPYAFPSSSDGLGELSRQC